MSVPEWIKCMITKVHSFSLDSFHRARDQHLPCVLKISHIADPSTCIAKEGTMLLSEVRAGSYGTTNRTG